MDCHPMEEESITEAVTGGWEVLRGKGGCLEKCDELAERIELVKASGRVLVIRKLL